MSDWKPIDFFTLIPRTFLTNIYYYDRGTVKHRGNIVIIRGDVREKCF